MIRMYHADAVEAHRLHEIDYAIQLCGMSTMKFVCRVFLEDDGLNGFSVVNPAARTPYTDTDRKYSQRWRTRQRLAGICVGCGNAKAVAYCARCRRLRAAQSAVMRAARIAAGLCGRCAEGPPVDGRVSCRRCLDRDAAAHARRKAGKVGAPPVVCMPTGSGTGTRRAQPADTP